ncbi:glycoside hydrolase family 32 protein [Exiguobacterium marinum]|uniref:Sucrose-6-phosphate hydrolase n=1 Tax=Exiguobacterium marinum TaxID=273528 RepID=A0ABY7WXB9_9BACL|nr:glycoside hydrolase family 32 protein [Exiguobacterium marinum]WDH75504.1 glycoside hydrolase family 32 protein [Exiguobacterium marinum]
MTYRPLYHFAPSFGWMNDPNGLCQFNGVYHLFYQYHPFGVEWDDMHWGHATSTNLVHWEHKPIALRPGDDYDKDGVFSGSALVKDGVLHLYYTGNTWLDEKRETLRQVQCLATSTDGITFQKSARNPLISGIPARGNAHVRDPKVWGDDRQYYMVLGTRDETDGKVILYESDDALHWRERGIIAGETGQHGWMWECPDLFHLDGHEILLLSPQGMEIEGDRYQNLHQCGYFIGGLDVTTPCFTHGSFTELDYGHDFYAAQTFLDDNGRRILIAWNAMWERDWPEQQEGWTNQMTIPRELTVKNGRLWMKPVEELKSLRQSSISLESDSFTGKAFELEFDVKGTFQFSGFEGTVTLSATDDHIQLTRDNERRRINERCERMRIFVDSSSIEVFVNEGEYVFSSRIYPVDHSLRHHLNGEVSNIILHSFE